jgi:hypothetical protein
MYLLMQRMERGDDVTFDANQIDATASLAYEQRALSDRAHRNAGSNDLANFYDNYALVNPDRAASKDVFALYTNKAFSDMAMVRCMLDYCRFNSTHRSFFALPLALSLSLSLSHQNAICSLDLITTLNNDRYVLLALDPQVCYALRRYDVPCTFKAFEHIVRPARIANEQLWTKKKVCR